MGVQDIALAKISITAGLCAGFLPRLPGRISSTNDQVEGHGIIRISVMAAIIALGVVAALIVPSSIAGLQKAITIVFLCLATLQFLCFTIFRSDAELREIIAGDKDAFFVLLYQLRLIEMLCFAVLNEIFAKHLTTELWLISIALMPLVTHPLKVWTYIAMFPWEEEAD